MVEQNTVVANEYFQEVNELIVDIMNKISDIKTIRTTDTEVEYEALYQNLKMKITFLRDKASFVVKVLEEGAKEFTPFVYKNDYIDEFIMEMALYNVIPEFADEDPNLPF